MARGDDAGAAPRYDWRWRHLVALLAANVALAIGPWWVRVADSGPVSAGFWRLMLALPFLFLLARVSGQRLGGFGARSWWVIAAAGVAFAFDLASWHAGIPLTRLGNATLFGNGGSLILMVWGLVALHRAPSRGEWAAVAAALGGSAILFARSLQIGPASLAGDLLCLLAGGFYAVYILLLQGARHRLGNWSLLAWSSLFGAPVMLAAALLLGEPVWPQTWWPVIGLALTSQLFGQGLLVYSLKHFPPLLIGLVLLLQPGVGALVGWLAFEELLTAADVIGMLLVGGALVLASARGPATKV
jgi:drug/metabolite transporter (DMT)-like permease